jgi:RNA polymerase sigma factor (sigma-70 family)
MAGEGRLDADRLCRLYADQVYRFAAMVSNRDSDAEDLAQDALERAIRAIDRYDSLRGTVDAWLWRIVVNTARDRGRVEQRNWMLLERISALLPRQSLDADQMTDSALLDDDLLDALRRLPRRARALIALRFGADLPPSGDHAGSQSLAKWPASVAAACTATAPWKALSSAGVFSPDASPAGPPLAPSSESRPGSGCAGQCEANGCDRSRPSVQQFPEPCPEMRVRETTAPLMRIHCVP